MVILKDINYINLSKIVEGLGFMKIEKLNIFCIDNRLDNTTINYAHINKSSDVRYTEMNLDNFIILLNSDRDFWEYNKDTLYILRYGNFLDIKNIFSKINQSRYNIGRGGSQKSHVISPLEFRLSSYLMAMLDFDYQKISKLNFFNQMDKARFLSYKDMSK